MTTAKKLALDLAQFGRRGDTMLMHVNPIEVFLLQKMAEEQGKTLTINPDTGLVEAFSWGDAAKIAGLAAATYFTGGALAPYTTAALGGSALAGGVAANALASTAITKIANPEVSNSQLATGAIGGALVGGALGGLGDTIGQFGAQAGPVAEIAEGAATAANAGSAGAAGSMAGAAGAATSSIPVASTVAGMDTLSQAGIGSGSAAAEAAAAGSPMVSSVPSAVPTDMGAAAFNAPLDSGVTAADGFRRGMDNPGGFADHVLTKGTGNLSRGMVGASLLADGLQDQTRSKDPMDPEYHGEYTIHDVFGTPQGTSSGENRYVKARTVKFMDGGGVQAYASGGRAVDPHGRAPRGTDMVPAMIDGKQPARIDSGEYIMTKRAVQNAGGPKAMDKIHAKLKSGKGLGGMRKA